MTTSSAAHDKEFVINHNMSISVLVNKSCGQVICIKDLMKTCIMICTDIIIPAVLLSNVCKLTEIFHFKKTIFALHFVKSVQLHSDQWRKMLTVWKTSATHHLCLLWVRLLRAITLYDQVQMNLCLYSYSYIPMPPTMKTESCHDANFVITGDTAGCHNDNLRCHQWRHHSWHHGAVLGFN